MPDSVTTSHLISTFSTPVYGFRDLSTARDAPPLLSTQDTRLSSEINFGIRSIERAGVRDIIVEELACLILASTRYHYYNIYIVPCIVS